MDETGGTEHKGGGRERERERERDRQTDRQTESSTLLQKNKDLSTSSLSPPPPHKTVPEERETD